MKKEFEITRKVETEAFPIWDGNVIVYSKWVDKDGINIHLANKEAYEKLESVSSMMDVADKTILKIDGDENYRPVYVLPEFVEKLEKTGTVGDDMVGGIVQPEKWGDLIPDDAKLIFASFNGTMFKWPNGEYITTVVTSVLAEKVHYIDEIKAGKYDVPEMTVDWTPLDDLDDGLGETYEYTFKLSVEGYEDWHNNQNYKQVWDRIGGTKAPEGVE